MWQWIVSHPWSWPIVVNQVFAILWVLYMILESRNPIGYQLPTIGYPWWHYLFALAGGFIYLVLLFATPFAALFLLKQYEKAYVAEIKEKAQKIIQQYNLLCRIAPPKFDGGYRRLMVICPNCSTEYSFFGYGKCTSCGHRLPLSKEERGALADSIDGPKLLFI